ncbi:hypothetical protein HRI_000344600 [Hibiscus trionum]|uniref:Uncharacterized protein n=1 Tax=Hibiscus trionum TaxID=183268 RepID=A0A9W7LJ48_HIBTR|nr:hypothetical protein HRI_000344600 [Hibiscus trionum]
MEAPVPDSISAVHNATNLTRDLESELEVGQEGKIREIFVDNTDSEPMKFKGKETSERIIATQGGERRTRIIPQQGEIAVSPAEVRTNRS